jgi:hypothetical protein
VTSLWALPMVSVSTADSSDGAMER